MRATTLTILGATMMMAMACGPDDEPLPETPSWSGEGAGTSSPDGVTVGTSTSSSGSGAGAGSSSGTGGPTGPAQVCVYHHSSYTNCAGTTDSSSSWKCSEIGDLDACRDWYESDSDYVDPCTFSDTYSQHQIVDGPCDEALAAIEGGGSNGGTGGGSGGGSPDCGGCEDVCLQAGYTGFGGQCDANTCYCSNECGGCVDACEQANYSGFGGICDESTGSCTCRNDCGGCEAVCQQSNQTFSGVCTETSCYCN